jgi:hypothetical protein
LKDATNPAAQEMLELAHQMACLPESVRSREMSIPRAEDTAGRILAEALRLGAFRSADNAILRSLVSSRIEKHHFAGAFLEAVSWLRKHASQLKSASNWDGSLGSSADIVCGSVLLAEAIENNAVNNAPEAAKKTRTRRTAVPKRIEKILFQESGSRCCMCNEEDIHKLTIHHIIPWADNPTHDVKHMVVLCANCHASATAGTISKEELYAAKEGSGRIIPLRTASTEKQPFSVSGNGNVVAGRDLNYTIRVSHKDRGAKPIQVPVSGTVSEDPLMRGYLKYLFDRYLAFKKWECDKKGVELTGAPIYRGYKRDMKFDWKLTPKSHFEKGAEYLKQRINKTTLARKERAQGNRLYRSFEEFQAIGPDQPPCTGDRHD